MIKLIATDLDGSLLSDDKKIPEGFFELTENLKKKGIVLVLASGRPYCGMIGGFEALEDYLYFISDNGSYIKYQNKELYADALDDNAVKDFVKISRNIEDAYAVMCAKEMAYMESDNEEFLKETIKYYKQYQIVPDLLEVSDSILKFSICDLGGSAVNSYPHYKKYELTYKVAVSGPIWLDVTNFNTNKGIALKKIQKLLNINPEETMTFGDYLNDMEMMSMATYSYAMKNAQKEVIDASNFITEFDNNHGGVVKTIEQVCFGTH